MYSFFSSEICCDILFIMTTMTTSLDFLVIAYFTNEMENESVMSH